MPSNPLQKLAINGIFFCSVHREDKSCKGMIHQPNFKLIKTVSFELSGAIFGYE